MLSWLLLCSGSFTLMLGLLHFWFPYLLDFENAIPREGGRLKKFRLLFIRHPTTRQDVRTVVRLMNSLVSFTLVSIGLLDLTHPLWLSNPMAPALLAWVTVWWGLRLGYQFLFEGSLKSYLLCGVFLMLAGIHAGALVAGLRG